ncbi:hypothetical protein [Nonomuraea dietziae]|uniref:hypothetical protein n=1 Tax=Nonomuraea dietziae TaxID=65515 RepID=UPI0031CE10A4
MSPRCAQFGAMAALGAVLAGEAALLVRGRNVAPAPQLASSPSCSRRVGPVVRGPADRRTSTEIDWVFGAANWCGRRRPARSAAALLRGVPGGPRAHCPAAPARLDSPHPSSAGPVRHGSVSVVGFPLCVAVMAAILHRLGAVAAASHLEIERVRASEAGTAEAHRRRLRRSRRAVSGHDSAAGRDSPTDRSTPEIAGSAALRH